ncbi:hypothetical protein STEG23_035474 [Scotinomys teguina]
MNAPLPGKAGTSPVETVHASKDGTPHGELSPPTSIINQENAPTDILTGQNTGENSSIEVAPSQVRRDEHRKSQNKSEDKILVCGLHSCEINGILDGFHETVCLQKKLDYKLLALSKRYEGNKTCLQGGSFSRM